MFVDCLKCDLKHKETYLLQTWHVAMLIKSSHLTAAHVPHLFYLAH